MSTLVQTNSFEDDRFKSISDFKWSMKCGGEVTFEWKRTMYGVFRLDDRYCLALINGENEQWFDSLDDLLNTSFGDTRFRDIVTQVIVWSRNT